MSERVNPEGRGRGSNTKRISLAERSPEERKKIASMGGKAGGEAKRKKKKMREYMLAVLEGKAEDSDLTNAELLTLRTFKQMLNDPNIKDYKTLCEVLGELKSADGAEGAQVVINVNSEGIDKEDIDKLL